MNEPQQRPIMQPSLLASYLRGSKAKPPRFKVEHPRWSRWKRRLMIFSLLVVAVGIIVYSQRSQPAKSAKPLSDEKTESVATRVILKQGDRLTTSELIAVAQAMQFDPAAELPIQMEWVQERLKISKLLSEKPRDDLAHKEGTLYRLEALQNLSFLNRKHDLGLQTVDTELAELCAANLNHTDPEVSKIAAVAIMMSAMQQFTLQPNSGNLTEALEKCHQICSQLNDDHEIALAIYTWARSWKNSDLLVDDAIEFFHLIIEHFETSSNPNARRTAADSYNEILFGDSTTSDQLAQVLLAGLNERFQLNRRSAVAELENRIRYSLHSSYLDQAGVRQLNRLLEILVINGDIGLALELLGEMEIFFHQLQDGALAHLALEDLAQTKTRLDLVDQPFDLSGLVDVDQPQGIQLSHDRPGLLVFWNPQDAGSVQLLNTLRASSIQELAQCVIICPDCRDDDLIVLQKLAKETEKFQFAYPAASSRGRQFVDRFPVPHFPYLVLLDHQHRAVRLNPNVKSLTTYIRELLP